LTLPELAALDAHAQAQPALQALRIECRKAQGLAPAQSAATLTVPCLGSVTAGHLMALHAAGHEVHLINRGWCLQCEAGAGQNCPAQAALETASLWLDSIGTPNGLEVAPPRWVDELQPQQAMPAAIPPAPEPVQPLSRRSFFREAMQRPTGRNGDKATPMGSSGRALYPAEQRRPSPERQRQYQALFTEAARQSQDVPAEFFPALTVDARCCDQQLCVAVCPTAALRAPQTADGSALTFDPVRCIACGTCTRACPQGAMTLQAHGGQAGVQTLIHHQQRACQVCSDTYTPGADDAGRCPSCEKSRQFMNDALRLFGPGARHASEGPAA
jgi:Fe-S-cluster-containing hydrogenase component 2